MGRVKIISRPNPNQLPEFQLPVHVRSAGSNESFLSWSENKPAARKPFVQVFWTERGMGEITLPRKKIIGIVRIDLNHLCNLFQIGRAENRLGFLLRFAQCRQQHPRQNCNDRDDDEEFYQRKTINRFTLK